MHVRGSVSGALLACSGLGILLSRLVLTGILKTNA
jgi:hypothetical protein